MFLEEMLINKEKVFTFKLQEYRQFYKNVLPPIIICTIKYKAWQVASYPCLKALLLLVIKMFKDRLDYRVLEYLEGLYRNR